MPWQNTNNTAQQIQVQLRCSNDFPVKILERLSRTKSISEGHLTLACLKFWIFILDTIYFDVGTKLPKIIVDNYDFNTARKSETKTTWICSSYFKTKCKTRATTCGRNVYITGPRHNHQPNPAKSKATSLMVSQRVTVLRNYKL